MAKIESHYQKPACAHAIIYYINISPYESLILGLSEIRPLTLWFKSTWKAPHYHAGLFDMGNHPMENFNLLLSSSKAKTWGKYSS